MKIISICYGAFPGTNAALQQLSRTVRLTRHVTLTSVVPDSPEVEFFAEYLREARPSLVIFGAWTAGYEDLLKALHPDTRAGVYWTSSTGQMDISNEAELFGTVLEHPRIRYKFFSQRAFAAALRARADCWELPVTLVLSAHASSRRVNAVPTISLFCAPNEYRRKNILNSLLAVAKQRQPYILYLNGLSENPHYRRLLEALQIRYHEWGWMTSQQYRRVVGRVDIGLQVSFSESFDYVAAEHVERGIPILVSKMVPALEDLPARAANRLVINNPDDPQEIAAKLDYLLAHPASRRACGETARRQFLKTNEQNIRQAKTLLSKIS